MFFSFLFISFFSFSQQNKTAITKSVSLCSRCNSPVSGNFTSAGGKIYHDNCFTCNVCNSSIGNGTYFEKDGIYEIQLFMKANLSTHAPLLFTVFFSFFLFFFFKQKF